ncbi:MAG: HAMP domain-containing histidine kinase [Bifidobacteriaceae bacterium]|jgi:two-component system OmpR family sensor kinase|nr:HAMP domain-containing histidine kinase [Bifidobacteriaceae bacterium]
MAAVAHLDDAAGSSPAGGAEVSPASGAPQRAGQPLAVKLAVIIAALVVLGLSASGTITTVVLRLKLVDEVDRQLVQSFTTLTERGQPDAAMSGPSDYVLMVFGSDGEVVSQRAGIGHDTAKLPAIERLTPKEARDRSDEPFTVGSTSGSGQWRCVTALVTSPFGAQPVLLALPLDSVAATTRQTALLVVWLTLAVAVVATTAGYAMVRRSLRPLREVERAAAQIAAGDLATRMPSAQPGTEVGHLTDSLNAMLTQIEAAFAAQSASEARMRTFVSDASHELRTPLAAIRGYAELHRLGGLDGSEAVTGAMRRIEDEATRMGAMVADLSILTRLAESPSLHLAPVDLLVLAADAVADAKALDPERAVTLVGQPGFVQPVMGDETALRRVLTNLVANAVAYTPPGTPLELAVGVLGSHRAVVEVRDHGTGIPVNKRAAVFDRFFRLDDSRSRGSGGTGLGLSIVAGLVTAHGGRVEVDDTPGGGATFRVILPKAP